MNRSLKIPALCALAPLLCSGLYGVVIGMQNSVHYLSAAPYSAFSAFWSVFLGIFRGVLTLLCAALCARVVSKGQIGPRHLILPAVLVCLHLLSLLSLTRHPPVTADAVLQLFAAVLALADMVFLLLWSRAQTGRPHAENI